MSDLVSSFQYHHYLVEEKLVSAIDKMTKLIATAIPHMNDEVILPK